MPIWSGTVSERQSQRGIRSDDRGGDWGGLHASVVGMVSTSSGRLGQRVVALQNRGTVSDEPGGSQVVRSAGLTSVEAAPLNVSMSCTMRWLEI